MINVKPLTLDVADGEFIVMVGPSGCGKSTLLRMVAGLERVTTGDIWIDRKRVTEMEPKDRGIAMVFQNYALYPHMSVEENMAWGLKIRGMGKQQIAERVKEAARILELDGLLKRRPRELSGGQRQRISLARAILKDAPIVVLDEATAYADPENEEKMEAAIAELVKGKTLVVIAHKLPAIMNADQICVIDHGKLVAAGKHQDLIRSCPEYQKLWKAAQDSAEWKVHTAKEGA